MTVLSLHVGTKNGTVVFGLEQSEPTLVHLGDGEAQLFKLGREPTVGDSTWSDASSFVPGTQRRATLEQLRELSQAVRNDSFGEPGAKSQLMADICESMATVQAVPDRHGPLIGASPQNRRPDAVPGLGPDGRGNEEPLIGASPQSRRPDALPGFEADGQGSAEPEIGASPRNRRPDAMPGLEPGGWRNQEPVIGAATRRGRPGG
jgi:hypothetical protein